MSDEREVGTEEYVSVQTKLTLFIRKNIFDIAIVLICVARIIFGLAEIQKTGKTVAGIIADGAITLVFSVTLSRLLEGKGLKAGEKEGTPYAEELKRYKEKRDEAGKWIGKLAKWCKDYTEKHYKDKLRTMLLPLGLTYEQYINKEYDESKFTDEQKKRYALVKKAKVQRITTDNLMSGELESNTDIDYQKATKKEYVKRSASSDLLSKIILSVVFGYFTLPPITQWNWAGALWALLHTALILGLSIIKYFNAYNFVNEDLRAKLVDKTHKLTLFIKEQNENEQQTKQD